MALLKSGIIRFVMEGCMGTLLDVKGLRTQFFTQDGVVHAVNGISYTLD